MRSARDVYNEVGMCVRRFLRKNSFTGKENGPYRTGGPQPRHSGITARRLLCIKNF